MIWVYGLFGVALAEWLITPREPLHHLKYSEEDAEHCRCVYCLTRLGDL